METISIIFAVMVVFCDLSHSKPLERRQDKCQMPSWTLQSVAATYSDDTYTPGIAAVTITNSITNTTESFDCPLSFNTLCQLDGTPGDKDLRVYMQINMEAASISFNKTWTCEASQAADPAL